jgi:DNA-binding CsgD family transcriptional regulator
MDLAAHLQAVEVLTSPLDWGSQDAWLAESLERVRRARGLPASQAPGELEALLHLPGDEPGWLQSALDFTDPNRTCGRLPPLVGGSEDLLPLISLRCALAAGLTTIRALSPALPTTQELRISFGLRGREPQVALLAAEGLSNSAIAERLRLSAHTVRHYVERVLDRLGLHSRKALALRLMENGERQRRSDRPG